RRAEKWIRRNPVLAGLAAACAALFLFGIGATVAYLVRTSLLFEQVLANESRAKKSEKDALEKGRQAIEGQQAALDGACRGDFERAAALRLAGRPGWRPLALAGLKRAADHLRRPRLAGTEKDLPSATDLRGEAVMALLGRDVYLVREIPTPLSDMIQVSPDGRRLLSIEL